ncbi:MAG TPA: hypothetical protein VFE54_11560 [Mucilaginibacter sp.]|jgi:hypothetical protein|nr:hypothetical protein [Mucilaginibacter sp.]
MKKLFILAALMISAFLTLEVTAMSTPSARYQQLSSETLVLNNGAKWKVDKTTNANVKNLKTIVQGFGNGKNASLNAYHKTAGDLQSGLNKMISECKMKGPDHLALHKWLEPLMEQVAKLKQASTVPIAVKSFQAVKLQLDRYDQYFEL